MPRSSFAIPGFIPALILAFSVSTIAQLVYIPTPDPINDEIEELMSRGYLRTLSPVEKPWLVSDVVESIRKDEIRFDGAAREVASDILVALEPPQRIPEMSSEMMIGADLRGLSRERREGYFLRRGRYISRGFKNEFGSIFHAGAWFSREDSWGIDSKFLYDTDGTGYPWYYGRARNARIIVQFDHAYAMLRLGALDLTLGRQRMIWGPSPRGSLLIDDGSPPLDMARAAVEITPFKLSWFVARLDDYDGYFDPYFGSENHRFLAGHRLALNTGKGWELGVSEIVLYGGPQRLPEIYYSIPVLLYYWEAHNHRIDDNIFWAFDLSYSNRGLGRFYMQFVADDIQYKHNGPQKFAVQAGAHIIPSKFPGWSSLVEFNMVDTYVYGQRRTYNAFLNWGNTISRLDSDQYESFIAIYRNLSPRLKAGAEYARRAKGEYEARMPQVDPLPLDTKFPSGVVEVTDDFRLSGQLHAPRAVDIGISVGVQSVDNYLNVESYSLSQFYATIDVSYSFDMGLPFWTKYR